MDEKLVEFFSLPEWSIAALGKDRLVNNYHLSLDVLRAGTEGDWVELGVYRGGNARMLALTLANNGSNKKLHLYDSFQGLPELRSEDMPDGQTNPVFYKGAFQTSSLETQKNLAMIAVSHYIHLGWIEDTVPEHLPDKIAYAHIDVDLYGPVLHSLEHVYPRLSPGAICIIDDYSLETLPGAKKATDVFMADKPEKLIVLHNPHSPPLNNHLVKTRGEYHWNSTSLNRTRETVHAYFKKI